MRAFGVIVVAVIAAGCGHEVGDESFFRGSVAVNGTSPAMIDDSRQTVWIVGRWTCAGYASRNEAALTLQWTPDRVPEPGVYELTREASDDSDAPSGPSLLVQQGTVFGLGSGTFEVTEVDYADGGAVAGSFEDVVAVVDDLSTPDPEAIEIRASGEFRCVNPQYGTE